MIIVYMNCSERLGILIVIKLDNRYYYCSLVMLCLWNSLSLFELTLFSFPS